MVDVVAESDRHDVRRAVGAQCRQRCQMAFGEKRSHLRRHVHGSHSVAMAWRMSSLVARHAGTTAAITPTTKAMIRIPTMLATGTEYFVSP